MPSGTQFKANCPHCLTKAAGFEFVFQWEDRKLRQQAFLVGKCGVCNKGVVLHARATHTSPFPNLTTNQEDFERPRYETLGFWPARSLVLPEDLPPNVESFFLQGLENLKGQRWDAAGAMFRKTLDVATKIIAPDLRNENLFARINKLVETNLLTQAMGEWSHEIRLDGNSAIHDDDPESQEDAEALQKFSEAFLTYAFSLPSLVARNRAKREPPTEVKAAPK